jgi:hypothetical protein
MRKQACITRTLSTQVTFGLSGDELTVIRPPSTRVQLRCPAKNSRAQACEPSLVCYSMTAAYYAGGVTRVW